jgi:hypothetical protein
MATLQSQLDLLKQQSKKQKLPAPLTFTLQPHHYNDEFVGRPSEPVVLGLRNHTEQDYTDSIAQADAGADKDKDKALMVGLVCRAMCDPTDVSRFNPSFPRPDDILTKALRPTTIRAIWDAIERHRIETSAIMPEATDEDIGNLLALLQTDRLSEIEPVKARRVRRFLRYCLDDLDG